MLVRTPEGSSRTWDSLDRRAWQGNAGPAAGLELRSILFVRSVRFRPSAPASQGGESYALLRRRVGPHGRPTCDCRTPWAAGPRADDWQRLHDLYRPLIRTWLARAGGLADDADDLAQEVLVVVVRELPGFRRQRDGSFRTWLRRVTVNRVRSWRRTRRPVAGFDPTDQFLTQLEDPASELSLRWDQEHDRHVLTQLLAAARTGCEPTTWDAFRLFALEGLSAAEAATRTGLSENAVMLAKSRLLRRLRQQAAGLID